MKERLLSIIINICEEDSVSEDLDLFEEGLMDSLSMTELLIAIEDEFGVIISPTEYEKEQLSTVNKIEKILIEKGIKE